MLAGAVALWNRGGGQFVDPLDGGSRRLELLCTGAVAVSLETYQTVRKAPWSRGGQSEVSGTRWTVLEKLTSHLIL